MTKPVIDDSPILFYASTDDGKLVNINQRLCRLLGYRAEELYGQRVEVFLTRATAIFQQTHLFPLLKIGGHAEEIFLQLKTKDGRELPVLINAERKQVDDTYVSIFAGILVLNRKKYEDELLAARKAAETALKENTALLQAKKELEQHTRTLDEQMQLVNRQKEELQQFSKVVTHDLQEPLRKLFLFVEKLSVEHGEAKDANTLEKVRAMAGDIRSIVAGLQQYVWLNEASKEKHLVDVLKILSEQAAEFESSQSETVVRFKSSVIPCIEADGDQLRFLFREILTNACRFRNPDQPLNIEVRVEKLQGNTYQSLPDKFSFTDFLRIEIQDNGIGILEEHREQAFDLFRRLHPLGGRGVGLSLCKKIVKTHKGRIALNSGDMQGTTVTIWLPITQKL